MDGKRILITGITGFVGGHLASHLLEKHPEALVYGLRRWRSPDENVRHLMHDRRVKFLMGDLLDEASLRRAVDQADPDYVFHLAAQSFVPYSYSVPRVTLDVNGVGTANLLEALLAHRDRTGKDPVIHVCSSSEVYGQPRPQDVPMNEDHPLRPISPYGVSKVTKDLLGMQYWVTHQLKTIRTRMFTHTGPRRGPVFVLPAFALQVVEIEKGLREPEIRVGNLDSVRTFADVRDAVEAYRQLVLKCEPGEVYNIGGNRTMTISEMLDIVIGRSSLESRPSIVVDKALLRPTDVTLQIPDMSKFQDATGWTPQYTFEQTVDDTLDHLRNVVYANV